jgi:NAD-dependent dihydropyrimidine dehydrogenase PreA subunit
MDVIVTDRCQGCGACLLTCPEHAFRPQPAHSAHPADLLGRPHGSPLLVVQELCTGCLECIEICPADAIEARVAVGEEGS